MALGLALSLAIAADAAIRVVVVDVDTGPATQDLLVSHVDARVLDVTQQAPVVIDGVLDSGRGSSSTRSPRSSSRLIAADACGPPHFGPP